MSAPLDVVGPLQAKVERAARHIFDLQEFRDKWSESQLTRVKFEDDPNTGDRTYHITDAIPIPASAPLIIGDAIHNLRSALDHLAYRLMIVGQKSSGPFRRVYFPIAENGEKYEVDSPGKMEGMREDAKKAINEIQPYGGGSGEILWHLHSLDVIDKHRLLIALGSCNVRYSMTPYSIAMLTQEFLGMDEDDLTPAQGARAFLRPSSSPKFPLKTNDVLATIPKAEVHENMHFPFEIAFGEQEVVAGDSVIEVLAQMKQRVDQIIRDFNTGGLLE
jgi:hypothetical protein